MSECNVVTYAGKGMMKRLTILALLAAVSGPASAGKKFMAYEGRDAIHDGVGGTKVTTDGIDFWTTGTPPHRFQVLGIIDDKRGSGLVAGKAVGAHSIAKMIRDAGGNAALVSDQSRAVTGFLYESDATLYGNTASGSGSAQAVEKVSTRFVVVKYLD